MAQALEIHQPDRDREDDGRERALRQILQRASQEEEHEYDDPGRHDLCELASSAGPFDHRGLRRAAVDDERSRERRGRVGRRQAEKIRVFVERLVVSRGVGARHRSALRHDHEKTGARHRKERQDIPPAHLRQGDPRQAARHLSDDGDPAAGEIERGARRHGARDGKEGARQARREPSEQEDDRHDGHRDADRRRVRPRQTARHLDELVERPAARNRHAQHPGENRDADLEPDASQEPDEHRLREEVGKETDLQQPGEQQETGRQQSGKPRQSHVAPGRGGRHG